MPKSRFIKKKKKSQNQEDQISVLIVRAWPGAWIYVLHVCNFVDEVSSMSQLEWKSRFCNFARIMNHTLATPWRNPKVADYMLTIKPTFTHLYATLNIQQQSHLIRWFWYSNPLAHSFSFFCSKTMNL